METSKLYKYWLGEEKKICVLCKKEKGCLEHLLNTCEEMLQWTENLKGNEVDRCNIAYSERGCKETLIALKKIDRELRKRRDKP